MSDFDDLRAAVHDAARATVVPPFAAVERRARARQHRQVAGVAAALVAVVAAGAVAVPRGGLRSMEPAAPAPPASRTGTRCPEPPREVHTEDEVTVGASAPCGPCPERGEPVGGVGQTVTPLCGTAEDAETARCWNVPRPGTPGTRTVGSGAAGRTRWWVVAWTGNDRTRCVGWVSDPVFQSWQMDADNDTGPAGALRPVLSKDGLPVRGAKDWEWMLYWGAVPNDVVRVDLMDGKRVVGTLVPVAGGDRKYVAGVVRAPDGRHGEPVAYDAEGRRVPLPARS